MSVHDVFIMHITLQISDFLNGLCSFICRHIFRSYFTAGINICQISVSKFNTRIMNIPTIFSWYIFIYLSLFNKELFKIFQICLIMYSHVIAMLILLFCSGCKTNISGSYTHSYPSIWVNIPTVDVYTARGNASYTHPYTRTTVGIYHLYPS